MTEKPKAKRGFAAMSLEKRTEISRKGGVSVPPEKRAFSQDPDLASRAGVLGAEALRRPKGGS